MHQGACRQWLTPLTLSIGLLWSISSRGADPSNQELDLQAMERMSLEDILNTPIVTAAGGTEEEASMTPANVYLIDSETIASHGWRSLAEMLSHVPGLYVTDDLVLPSLGVRGMTGGLRAGTRIVKIMIDGHPVAFRPDLTAFLGPEFIPVEVIRRVEIAKGPLSALYGANAFIATVNVITVEPTPTAAASVAGRAMVIHGRGGYGASALLTQGSPDKGPNLLLSFSTDDVDRSGLRLRQTFDGQLPSQQQGSNLSLGNNVFTDISRHDRARPLTAFGRLGTQTHRLGEWTLTAGLQRLDSNAEFQINSILTHQSRTALWNFWSNLRYEQSAGTLTWVATLGYSRGGPTGDDRYQLTDNYSRTYTRHLNYWAGTGTASLMWTPFEKRLSFKVGLDFDYSKDDVFFYSEHYNVATGNIAAGQTVDLIDVDARRNVDVTDIGVYAQATSTPLLSLPNLRLTGNFRVDRISFNQVVFPHQTSWRASAAYRWTRALVTKLVAGSAFQTPSSVLLFGVPGFGASDGVQGSMTTPTPTPTRAQSVTNIEAMMSLQLMEALALELSGYYQKIADRIEFRRTAISKQYVATNAGDRPSLGVEATLRTSFGPIQGYLSGALDHDLSTRLLPELAPPQYPTAMGILGLEGGWKGLILAADFRVIGPRGSTQGNTLLNNAVPYALPGYHMFDLTLSTRRIKLWSGGETLFRAKAKNITNQQFNEPGFGGFDTPSLGRQFMIEIKQNI